MFKTRLTPDRYVIEHPDPDAKEEIFAPNVPTSVMFDYQISDPEVAAKHVKPAAPKRPMDSQAQESAKELAKNEYKAYMKVFNETQSDHNENVPNSLKGFVKNEDLSQEEQLRASMATFDGKNKLTGHVSDQELKAQKAMTQEQRNQMLFAQAIQNHGTPSLFLVSWMNGPWTISECLNGGAGAYAGLKPNDKILSVDGYSYTGCDIKTVYLSLVGKRGGYRTYKIDRGGKIMHINVPLWGFADIRDRRTQNVEYYWYLLYHGLIGIKEYQKGVQPFLYFKVPLLYAVPDTKKPVPQRKTIWRRQRSPKSTNGVREFP